MESFQKKPYKDGWPEDRWEEEMEKHPFFMTKSPAQNEELSPLVEGLQQLKYDENENTPDELANTYKEEGNFYFKCKKYREAITNYTAGLKFNCSPEIKASLFNNRGAANFYLKNYRSAISDSKNALELNPNYTKAKIRLAQSYFCMEKYDETIEICDEILSRENSETIFALRKNALKDQTTKRRDLRRRNKQEQKKFEEEKLLLNTVISKNIKVFHSSDNSNSLEIKSVSDIKELEPSFSELQIKRVHFQRNELVWPVVFLYPVYNVFDCIQEFNENTTFQNHLNEMLSERPEWDINEKYSPNLVSIYFNDIKNTKHRIAIDKSLKEVLELDNFALKDGVPLFFILPRDSAEEDQFLNSE